MATGLFPDDVECEYMHILATMFLELMGQCVENIVIGTRAANTAMLIFECELRNTLIKMLPDGFLLTGIAKLFPGTQVAEKISIIVTSPQEKGFSLHAEFDLLNSREPDISQAYYTHWFFETLLKEFISGHQSNSTLERVELLAKSSESPKVDKTNYQSSRNPASFWQPPKPAACRNLTNAFDQAAVLMHAHPEQTADSIRQAPGGGTY